MYISTCRYQNKDHMYLFKPRMLTRESKPNNSSLDSFWWPLTPSSGLGTSLAPAPNSPGVTTFMFLSKNLQMWDTHEAQLRYKKILSNMSTDHEIFINEKSFTSLKTHTLQEGIRLWNYLRVGEEEDPGSTEDISITALSCATTGLYLPPPRRGKSSSPASSMSPLSISPEESGQISSSSFQQWEGYLVGIRDRRIWNLTKKWDRGLVKLTERKKYYKLRKLTKKGLKYIIWASWVKLKCPIP